ncbi:MAG: site-2 protease family protein [Thermoplasmata archaeon]|nr:MAG: site-2 protease family protein [Thermoplasmata archaeon]
MKKMDMGYVYTLIAILLYILVLALLKIKGYFTEERFSLWGPLLIWRTQKGKAVIERLSKKRRFWKGYGTFAVGLVFVTMFFMMWLLVWSATLVPSIPRESAPAPQLLIGIPGINPIIPVWYGIMALAVAMVVHEFSHGILTRVADLKLKSLGIIACVVPIGAFVEPDEEEIKATESKKRMRVFAVGPSSNIIFALICAVLFSWVFVASVSPVHDGVLVSGALKDSPGYNAGLNQWWMEITEVNGTPIEDSEDFEDVPAPAPLQNTTVTYFYKSELTTVEVISGVVILHISEGYPADEAGLEVGMILAEINGTEIRNDRDFKDTMARTRAGQTVNISVFEYNDTQESYTPYNTSATLEDKYDYYEEHYPASWNKESYRGAGFLGVSESYLGLRVGGNPGNFMNTLSRPLASADSSEEALFNMAIYTLLPFQRLSPFSSPMTDLYEVEGPLAVLPADLFWILANIFYWLFWLNLMVGLTNALPAVPLDGGHIFKDGLDTFIAKIKSTMEQKERERYVRAVSYSLAFFVLFLILWQVIGPRI